MSSLTKNRTAVAAASSLEKDYEKNLIDAVPEQVIQDDELLELLEGGGAFAGISSHSAGSTASLFSSRVRNRPIEGIHDIRSFLDNLDRVYELSQY